MDESTSEDRLRAIAEEAIDIAGVMAQTAIALAVCDQHPASERAGRRATERIAELTAALKVIAAERARRGK